MKVYVGMVTGHDGFYDVGAADTLERARNKTLKDVIEAFGDRGYVWVNYTKHNISHLYEREELERSRSCTPCPMGECTGSKSRTQTP
jgi:hypothetical protein